MSRDERGEFNIFEDVDWFAVGVGLVAVFALAAMVLLLIGMAQSL